MFVSKRHLKKDKKKQKYKKIIFLIIFLLILLGIFELVKFAWSFTRPAYVSPIAAGSFLPESSLGNDLALQQIQFTKIIQDGNGSIHVYLKDGGEVILSSKKDFKQQVSSLQLILSRLTIEGKKLKVLDLRFAHPVISF
jgi:hypothetical protein